MIYLGIIDCDIFGGIGAVEGFIDKFFKLYSKLELNIIVIIFNYNFSWSLTT